MSNDPANRLEDIDENEINLLDYLAVIVKYRRMIVYMCTAAVIVAVIVSFLLPKIYTATSVIMPPKSEQQGTMAGLASKMGGLAALAGGMVGISDTADVYVEMLKSRGVKDTIIDRFNLLEVYDVEFMKEAREDLKDNTLIKISKANTISIEVEDIDPQRAADMANAYVDELDKLSRKLTVSDASRQRMFLEKRIEGTKLQLAQAELALKEFQEENKIVSLPTQTSTSIYGASRIKGEIISTETELKVLKSFATEKSNKIFRMEKKLTELKSQLAKIETGQEIEDPYNPADLEDNSGNNEAGSNFYIPFTQVPELGLQLSRLMRNVKVKETVYELLTEQYELAKIAELKDTTTIQILDKAVVPEKKSKPRRGLIVVLTGILSFFTSIFLAFTKEYFARMNDEDQKRWQDIKASVKGSIPFN